MGRSRRGGSEQRGSGRFIGSVNKQPGAKVGEILRKYGLYSSDLQNIRKMVREGSLERLRQSKPGRKKVATVSIKDYEELESELARKEKALGEMTVMFTTLKKKVNLE